jgi:hypothetical protein
MRQPSERRITVEERPRVPWDGALLGYAAVLPFPVAALAVWFGGPAFAEAALALVKLWGGFLLLFLAGVRRGLSFRTPGGPQPAQIAVSLSGSSSSGRRHSWRRAVWG